LVFPMLVSFHQCSTSVHSYIHSSIIVAI
jgi:hypothetical protein